MSFAVPNERREPMSGVTVSVPTGLLIVRARQTAGWTATFDGSSATWRGECTAAPRDGSGAAVSTTSGSEVNRD